MTAFKNICRKILCKLGRHKYIEDNEGISHIRNFFTFTYYSCAHCNKYKISFSNPIAPTFLRAIVKHKRDFEAESMRRKVIFEKTYKPKGPKLYSLSISTGEVTETTIVESGDEFYGFYDYGYNSYVINDDNVRVENNIVRVDGPFDI